MGTFWKVNSSPEASSVCYLTRIQSAMECCVYFGSYGHTNLCFFQILTHSNAHLQHTWEIQAAMSFPIPMHSCIKARPWPVHKLTAVPQDVRPKIIKKTPDKKAETYMGNLCICNMQAKPLKISNSLLISQNMTKKTHENLSKDGLTLFDQNHKNGQK